jgi:predicted MFS family arabinose efflux permease
MPQNSFFPIYLEEKLGLATVALSTLVAAGQVAGMVAGVAAGFLSDVLGSKWMLVAGIAGMALTCLAFITPSPTLVAVLWVINGAAIGLHTLGGQSYLTKAVSPTYLGLFSGLYELTLTMGGAVGSPGLGVLLDRQGFAVFSVVLLLVSLTTALVAIAFVPGIRTSEQGDRGTQRKPWRQMLGVFRQPAVPVLVLLRFLPTIFYGMATIMIPLLINRLAGSKTSVAVYGTVSLVLASTAQLLAGRAADRWGASKPTLISFGLIVASAGGLWVFSHQLWGIFVFGVIGYATAWALSALMLCLVSVSIPSEEHGSVLGLLHGSWSIGMVAGSLLGGVLARITTGLPFLVAGLLNVGAVALTVLFFSRFAQQPELTKDTASK